MLRRATIAAILCAAFAPATFATNATWTSTSAGNWLDATNWSTNPIVPNAIDDSATIAPPTLILPITLNGKITLGNLTFGSTFGTSLSPSLPGFSLTLQTSTGPASITNNATSGAATLTVPIIFASDTTITNNASFHALTFAGRLSGAANLTLDGTGPIVLNANDPLLTGNLILNAANVTAASANSLGTGNITLNAGSQLTLNVAASQNYTLNGGTLNSHSSSTATLAGTTQIAADSLITATSHAPIAINSPAPPTSPSRPLTSPSPETPPPPPTPATSSSPPLPPSTSPALSPAQKSPSTPVHSSRSPSPLEPTLPKTPSPPAPSSPTMAKSASPLTSTSAPHSPPTPPSPESSSTPAMPRSAVPTPST